MSTRCQIGFYEKKEDRIEDFKALIYRHSDGYPETLDGEQYGVLSVIIPFLKWWKNRRGLKDIEYVSARLLHYFCTRHDECHKLIEKQLDIKISDKSNEEFGGECGYGICKEFHGDIEYFYKIYPNEIEIYEIPFDSEPNKWKLINTESI